MFKRIVSGIFRHGRQVLEGVIKRPEPARELRRFTQLEVSQNRLLQSSWSGKKNLSVFGRFVTRYTSQCLAAELRRKAALQFQSGSFRIFGGASRVGKPLPLFAFLSVGLAAGVGIQSSEQDRYDPVCDHIKGLFIQRRDVEEEASVDREALGGGVADYTFGRLIAKGCHAAVYEASISQSSAESTEEDGSLDGTYSQDDTNSQMSVESQSSEIGDNISDDDSFVKVTADDESDCESFMVVSESEEDTSDDEGATEVTSQVPIDDIAVEGTDKGTTRCRTGVDLPDVDNATLDKFELAVKMMFNYAVESTAGAIVSAMERELLPVEEASHDEGAIMWQNGRRPKKKRLPPHPNIVHMVGCFIDDVPSLPGDVTEYPAALPTRLNPMGCGRNKTMFIVMKRYTCTLREHLQTHCLGTRESTVLLAQLMEAIVHLGDNDIAHRDLKSDNILLEDDGQCPHLVVADFGCSFIGGSLGLRLWYPSDEINKGGNVALMAPEIISAHPGFFSFLDYTKSDVWAVGALAYEIFGCANPFYGRVATPGKKLQNDSYTEKDLPDLPESVPSYMQGIVKMLLQRDPAKRPSAVCVADILHVLLWGPKQWQTNLESGSPPPKRRDVMRWLLTLSAEVMFQRWCHMSPPGVEYRLKNQFLSRLNLDSVMASIDCLWHLA